MTNALISGITGQDGSYLAENLLEKGYEVFGLVRRVSTPNYKNIEHLLNDISLIDGDLTDLPSIMNAIIKSEADEVYNLAAQSIAENEFIPLLKAQKLCLRTFKNLWEELKLKNTIKILQIDGIETEVIEVKSNQIRALGYTAGMGNWKKIIQISRHKYNGKMVRLNQKYGTVCATPYHSVYNIEGNLCDAIDNPVLLPMRKINYYSHLKEEVEIKIQGIFESDNDWFWSTKKSDVKFPKVVNKDTLEEFLRFCAAYIAEGCCHSRDNGWQDVVIISNNDKSWLESVEKDIKKVIPGISCYYTESKKENYDSTWNMCISDKTLYQIIVSLCGKGSINKRIPDFVFKLKEKYKVAFIDKLVEGDGCVENRNLFNTIRYTTVSKELATGLCLLLSLLNRDYTCRMYEDNNEDHNAVYFIREVKSYQLQQGIEQRKLDLIDYDGYVYDIAVEGLHNFTVGVGNIVVHNSFVATSWQQPVATCNVTAMGALNVFEAVRKCDPYIKTYQASSSELYSGLEYPQTEETQFKPRSPYGVSKLFAHNMARIYRESYNMFVSCGILYNHASPRRGIEFVTQKIVDTAVRQYEGEDTILELGNLEACRDWSHAKDMCIDLDVPILTTSGWKMHHEIEMGDEIINFNSGKNHITKDIVKEKVYIISNGRRVLLKGRGVYLKVTPSHRLYYQKKSKNSQSGWSNWKVTTAEEFHNMISDKSSRTKYDYRLPHFQDYDGEDVDLCDDQIYLLGALLTEGCLHQLPLGRGTQASISQSEIDNKNAYNKIETCINTLGLIATKKLKNTGVTEWVFNADSSRTLCSWFDNFNFHVMPRYCYSFSTRQANILFDAMMDCDGHWGSLTYKSSRYDLAVAFQTIAHLAGYRTSNIRTRKNGGGELVKQISQCFEVGVITKSKKYTYIQESELLTGEKSIVWCIKTKNGTIITRDNNCISISGNCEGMWLILQQNSPQDFILCSGETHSVREFVNKTYEYLDIELVWEEGELPSARANFRGKDRLLVQSVEKFYRPNEVNILQGDPTKARKVLGWKSKYTFDDLITDMIVDKSFKSR